MVNLLLVPVEIKRARVVTGRAMTFPFPCTHCCHPFPVACSCCLSPLAPSSFEGELIWSQIMLNVRYIHVTIPFAGCACLRRWFNHCTCIGRTALITWHGMPLLEHWGLIR